VVGLHGIPIVPESYQVLDSVGRCLNRRREGDPPHDERGDGPTAQGGCTDTPVSQPEPRPARWGEGALELRIAAQLPRGTHP
jgi:hypothetical protein